MSLSFGSGFMPLGEENYERTGHCGCIRAAYFCMGGHCPSFKDNARVIVLRMDDPIASGLGVRPAN